MYFYLILKTQEWPFPSTALIWFITEARCVYCAVGAVSSFRYILGFKSSK